MKLKLSLKKFHSCKSMIHLRIKIDENLSWKHHIHDIAIRLNNANAILLTIRNYFNRHLRSI